MAIALATAGLLLFEHKPAASAAAAPHVVHTATHLAPAVASQVAVLTSVSTQLRGTASLLKQTLPDLDAGAAARAAAVAAKASQAAVLSERLSTITTSARTGSTGAQANTTAAALKDALSATSAQATAASAVPAAVGGIAFCNFTIQIGPIIINIPSIGFHLQIGPFFIHLRAPCFLSGRLPTHVG